MDKPAFLPKISQRVSSRLYVATPEMISAGVEVLYRWEKVVSKATLVQQLWEAMAHLCPSLSCVYRKPHPS